MVFINITEIWSLGDLKDFLASFPVFFLGFLYSLIRNVFLN